MIHSMTGFGKAELLLPNKRVDISVKSLNGKTTDINIRLPLLYRDNENDLRAFITSKLIRGKIDISVSVESNSSDTAYNINAEAVKKYADELKNVTGVRTLDDSDIYRIVMHFPHVLVQDKEKNENDDWPVIMKAVEKAVFELIEFRKREGKELEADLRKHMKAISGLQKAIPAMEPERVGLVKKKLTAQLEQLALRDRIDRDRFEQELIYYLERMDITEENIRLNAHIKLFIETLDGAESQGKKLGFICQEIGREINTIGSKANHAEIQKIVVEMKDELEKIKEQLNNIL